MVKELIWNVIIPSFVCSIMIGCIVGYLMYKEYKYKKMMSEHTDYRHMWE